MTTTKENRALVLIRAAEALANGNLQARVPASPYEDLGPLCATFNRMAEAIGQREQERLELSALTAHDLRTPLTVVRGSALMLLEEKSIDSMHELLTRIVESTDEMERIIVEFTDDARMRTGRLELRCAEVDLSTLARTVVAESSTAWPDHRLGFEGDGTCPIWGDRSRLKRMLQNLISNAVKYSAPGREVNTSVWRRGTEVWLTVEDQGEGIRPSDTERIFRPFLRLDATSTIAAGSGLGLSSVQKIVESHSGEISVQGEPGRGTTIEIRFKARLPKLEQPGAVSNST